MVSPSFPQLKFQSKFIPLSVAVPIPSPAPVFASALANRAVGESQGQIQATPLLRTSDLRILVNILAIQGLSGLAQVFLSLAKWTDSVLCFFLSDTRSHVAQAGLKLAV